MSKFSKRTLNEMVKTRDYSKFSITFKNFKNKSRASSECKIERGNQLLTYY